MPVFPALQPNRGRPKDTRPVITAEQVYMEAWMNVIHGAKGILWFPYFDRSTIRWEAMKRFSDQMKSLSSIVLGPETDRIVTDDANKALRRVDTLVRKNGNEIYIFATRITEPDPIPEAKYRDVEPDSIVVNFKVGSIIGINEAEVVDEGRTISITNGQLTDIFMKNDVHIYKIVLNPTKWFE